MARVNTRRATEFLEYDSAEAYTHGGSIAARIGKLAQLRRSVLSTLLFEKQFYEDGIDQYKRIRDLALECDAESVAKLAVEARVDHGLRHAPLVLLVALTKTGTGIPGLVADTIAKVVTRADQAADLLALYFEAGRRPLSAQLKKGLARALEGFDRYQIAKYANTSGRSVSLRDVLFLSHARSVTDEIGATFSELVDKKLRAEDTWEAAASHKDADMKAEFTSLLESRRLGYTALLRNLNQMDRHGVDERLVKDAILARRGARNVFPLQFYAAAQANARYSRVLEQAMLENVRAMPKLAGKTVVIGDISGSMGAMLSGKGAYSRYDAMAVLMGSLVAMSEDVVVYATAGDDCARKHATCAVDATEGFGMAKTLRKANRDLGGGGIFLRQAMDYVYGQEKSAERVIVITDEQDTDSTAGGNAAKANTFGRHNYLINVASYRNGIGYKAWTHIDGFSEAVLRWIPLYEQETETEDE